MFVFVHFVHFLYIDTLCKCIPASIRLIEVVELPSCLSSAVGCALGERAVAVLRWVRLGVLEESRVEAEAAGTHGDPHGGGHRLAVRWTLNRAVLGPVPCGFAGFLQWIQHVPMPMQHGQCMQVSMSSGHTSFNNPGQFVRKQNSESEGTAVFK